MKKLKNEQPQLQVIFNKTKQYLLDRAGFSGEGIYGCIVDARRGTAYHDGRFSVPMWAYKDPREGYFMYYLAHELAHELCYKAGVQGHHDFNFYKMFMKLCPPEFQKYELGYKPTSSKYGITE